MRPTTVRKRRSCVTVSLLARDGRRHCGSPELLDKRREVQRRRRRADSEIFALFNRPFVPFSQEEGYIEGSVNVRAAFGLDQLFTRQRVTRVLVVATTSRNDSRDCECDEDLGRDDTSHPRKGRRCPERAARRVESRNRNYSNETRRGDQPADQRLARRRSGGRKESSRARPPATRGRLARLSGGRAAPGSGQWHRVVLGSALGKDSLVLREIIQEPWRWRRDKAEVPSRSPRTIRSCSATGASTIGAVGLARRTLRVTQRWLPEPVERSVRRLLRRPHLSG